MLLVGALAACGDAPLRVPPVASSSAAPRTVATQVQLPRGGTTILGRLRVIAYYGAAGTAALGTLGAGSPEHAARRILARANSFTPYGPVQPAMELLATVAQASPGRDGDYSSAVSHAKIAGYLAAAHRHKMLLLLDLQPGRASFLAQVKGLGSLLLDPSVGVALDPEWKVTGNQRPGGGRIGSSSAAGINAVGAYLSALVRTHRLPDKLLIVHQFTNSMLPDRAHITKHAGVETVFHADGFGTPSVKRSVYHQLRFPGRPFGTGFKLFFHQDSRLMSPKEVMALRLRPDVVTYQ